MQPFARRRTFLWLSLLFALPPFAFSIIRAVETGWDLRFLWMAFASFLGASLVMAIGKARRQPPRVVVALSAGALVIAMLFAGSTAFLLGATSQLSVWFVAFGFSLCLAASCALDSLSRSRPD